MQFDEGMGLLGECFWEIHSGGFARYSAAYLQRLWTCALFSQMSGDDEQTADKDFLEDTQVAAKPVPDEILLKASQKVCFS